MHHHPLPMGSTWLDGVALRDATTFWSIIDANESVRGVVCGHVHQAADRTRNRVRFLSTPSTCAQFLPGSEFFALDDRPPGMRWIELHADGRIETEVAWVPSAARS
jgi:Icc protein